ncbi:hypothetical protein KC19_1G057500 [Ceratodon purpureus]|uniref:Uncharacterized protein n=2 Tax=Ceratodon purpureus TaxID=3225 RepID=A0A8T0J3Y5_CERPU|nr:hypothetical protein KC19_1G057500 [Ceratodon purpureus]
MLPRNSAEDHEAGSSQSSECSTSTSASASSSNCCPQQPTRTQCNHLDFKKAAAQDSNPESEHVPAYVGEASTSSSVPSHPSSSRIPQLKQNFRPKSGLCLPSSPKQNEQSSKAAVTMSRRISLGSAPGPDTLPRNSPTWLTAEEPIRQRGQGNLLAEDPLQWLQALELQVVGACRSDERLRPLLRWNVSCFGSDGRLLAHLGQHFKARELALLARCLCTPVVSLRVGKVSRHGRYLYPTSARGFLNLMLLPCSEMRLAFADDLGTVERVAVTIPGVESGGIIIEELKEDTSQRTFVLKDRAGNITNYFWQSEKLKSTGDELITKIRNMLKRRPTLAHLTGIDEGRLDSFADYLRNAIFSKTSTALSEMPNPTQLVPSLESDEKTSKGPPSKSAMTLPFRKALLKFSAFSNLSTPTDQSQNHIPSQSTRMGEPGIFQPFESSMEKLRRCMQEIDTSVCSDGPLSTLATTLPATAKLIESLKRLRNCLHSLSDRRGCKARNLYTSLPSSSQAESLLEDTDIVPYSDDRAHFMSYISTPLIRNIYSGSPIAIEDYQPKSFSGDSPVLPRKSTTLDESFGLCPCPSVSTVGDVNAPQPLPSTTVVYRDLGPTLDPAWNLQAHPVQYCHSVTKSFDFHHPLSSHSNTFLSEMFKELVSQMPLMISHLPNETVCIHNLYVLPFVLEHAGASSLPHLSALPHVLNHLWRAKLLHLPASGNGPFSFLRKSLPMPPAPGQSMSSHRRGGLVVHPSARRRVVRSNSRRLDRGMEIIQDRKAKRSKSAQCGACQRCETGTGLGNLVLVNFYAQQTGPRLRVVTAEITSGNISYIVRFLQSF